MKNTILLAGCVSALLLAGCVSSRQFVPLPDQAKKIDDPSKGRIYVMRPATIGAAVTMNVSDDGKFIGSTGPKGYLCWERQPGEAIISTTSEGSSQAPLSVQAGGVYYIFQHVRMGMWLARGELEIVNDEKGREVLKKCHPPNVEAPPPSPVSAVKEPTPH